MTPRLSSRQILELSDHVASTYPEPARSKALSELRDRYVRACREEREYYRNETTSIFATPHGKTECHVCDGRGEYSGRRGRVQCGRCYGKGYI